LTITLTLNGQTQISVAPVTRTITVLSEPISGLSITGTNPVKTDCAEEILDGCQFTLTAPEIKAGPGVGGFIATQGSGVNSDKTRIYDSTGAIVQRLSKNGNCMVFDKNGNLFLAESSLSSGYYKIYRYEKTGLSTWGPAVYYSQTASGYKPSAMAYDDVLGVLYVAEGSMPGGSIIWKITDNGATVTNWGKSFDGRMVNDMEVDQFGKLWLSQNYPDWGYFRMPLTGGDASNYEIRICNSSAARGFAFGDDRVGDDGINELFGSIDDTVTSFGYYDVASYEFQYPYTIDASVSGTTLLTDPALATYCMSFGPDRNGDGVSDIYCSNYNDKMRIYSGVDGTFLANMAEGMPNIYVTGYVPASSMHYGFENWTIDNVDQQFGQKTISFTADANKTVTANYTENYFVNGIIHLNDYVGDVKEILITIQLHKVGGSTTTRTIYPTDSEGHFVLDIERGTYDMAFKASHWLQKTLTGVAVDDNTIMNNLDCINGDVVDNNEVDFSDINAVRAAYGSFPGDETWNNRADVDGSGEIDFTDINIVRSNYGEIGE
jgi:hypothetical protein